MQCLQGQVRQLQAQVAAQQAELAAMRSLQLRCGELQARLQAIEKPDATLPWVRAIAVN